MTRNSETETHTEKKKNKGGEEVGFGSVHRPFMEQKSYFKSGLEIENKLDHARPLLKMICKDKWKRLERKLKNNPKHETTRALGLQRETGQGTGERKESSDNQMPKQK